MGEPSRGGEVTLLLLFLCALPGQSGGQGECLDERRRVAVGGSIDLRCTDCPGGAVWSKYRAQCKQFVPIWTEDDERRAGYFVQSATAQDGGVYRCNCTTSRDVSQCFNVTVDTHITSFKATPDIVRVNRSFILTCSAVGYPAPRRFKLLHSFSEFVKLEIMSIDEVSSIATYTVTPSSSEIYSGTYTCTACATEDDCRPDTSMTTVTVHEPPTIVEVKSFSVGSFSEQQNASLECTVQSWNFNATSVLWIRSNGSIIRESGPKYTISHYGNDSIAVYTVLVHNVQESDIGGYMCLLSSYDTVEDSTVTFLLGPPEKPGQDSSESGDGPPVTCPADDDCKRDLSICVGVLGTALVTVLVFCGFCAWRRTAGIDHASKVAANTDDANQGDPRGEEDSTSDDVPEDGRATDGDDDSMRSRGAGASPHAAVRGGPTGDVSRLETDVDESSGEPETPVPSHETQHSEEPEDVIVSRGSGGSGPRRRVPEVPAQVQTDY